MVQVSRDGQRLCTTSADKSIKFYDVVSFDMSHMIALKYTPTRVTWIHERGRKASLSLPCHIQFIGVCSFHFLHRQRRDFVVLRQASGLKPLGGIEVEVTPHIDDLCYFL